VPRALPPLVALALLLGRAAAAPSDYVGAEACGACHADILAAWRTTAHARAGEAQVGAIRAGAPSCRSCHATGDGLSARRPGVGCEACHGGGAAYARDDVMRDPHLSRLLGLRRPKPGDEAPCQRCHRTRTRPDGFDAAEAWRRTQHGS
jgi:hypothetical protein